LFASILLFLGALAGCSQPTPTNTQLPKTARTTQPAATPLAVKQPSATPSPPPTCPLPASGEILFRSVREDTDHDGKIDRNDQSDYAIGLDDFQIEPAEQLVLPNSCSRSPDGKWSAARSGTNLLIHSVDQLLTYTVSLDLDQVERWCWSPDSQRIAVGGIREENEHLVLVLYQLNQTGDEITSLLQVPFEEGDWKQARIDYIVDIHWFLDQNALFFTSPYQGLTQKGFEGSDGVVPTELFALDLDSGAVSRYESGTVRDPRWSPDQKTILYTRWDGLAWVLWLIDADGGNPRPLISEESYVEPAIDPADWSPDGCWIAFASSWHPIQRQRLEESEIFVVKADGTNVIRLTDDHFPDSRPIWVR